MNKKLTKLLSIFLIAGAIGTGVAFTATACGKKNEEKQPCEQHVDENKDGICDVCEEKMPEEKPDPQPETEFTVTFNVGDKGTAPAAVKTVNGKITAPETPVAAGFIFGGWYETADCSGKAVNFSRKVFTANTTLYAKWGAEVITTISGVELSSKTEGITITEGKISVSADVKEIKLAAVISGENLSNQLVKWSIDGSKDVATVSDGTVTIKSPGTVTVTATAMDDTTKSASVEITIAKVEVTGVTLDKTAAALEVDGEITLTATVAPENATDKTVTWTSDTPAVATVENGKVTAVAVGTAKITAKAGDKTAVCTVTVSAKTLAVESVAIAVEGEDDELETIEEIELEEDDELELIAVITPEGATNTNVTWASDDEEVVTVEDGYVTAVGVGEANITVTTEDGEKTATLKVTVVEKVIHVTEVSVANDITVKVGAEATIDWEVSPEDAVDTTVTFESEDETIATVDATGKVTGVKEGTTKIIITSNDDEEVYAECNVTVTAADAADVNVTSVTIKVGTEAKDKLTLVLNDETGKSATLTAAITPTDATNKKVTWSSSAPTVVSVSTTGIVTAVATGTAKITVTTEDGNHTADIDITVVKAVKSVSIANSKTMEIDDEETLTVTINPEDATNKSLSWTSDTPAVATVDATGKVTAVATGTAKITVTTEDGSKTSVCTITVNPKTVVTVSEETKKIAIGEDFTLTAEASNSGDITWESENSAIATVDATGKVVGVASGTVKIYAKTGKASGYCTVTVVKPVTSVAVSGGTSVVAGSDITLTATVTPSDADESDVTWAVYGSDGTSATDLATIDATGKLTAVSEGTVKVVATAGGVDSAAYEVTIKSLYAELSTRTDNWYKEDFSSGYTENDGKLASLPLGTDLIDLDAGIYPILNNSDAKEASHYNQVVDGALTQVRSAKGELLTVINFGNTSGDVECCMDLTLTDKGNSWTPFRVYGSKESSKSISEVFGLRTKDDKLKYRLYGGTEAGGMDYDKDIVYTVHLKYVASTKKLTVKVNGTLVYDDTTTIDRIAYIGLASSNSQNYTVTVDNIAICTSEMSASEYNTLVAKVKIDKELLKYVAVDKTDPNNVQYTSEKYSQKVDDLVDIYNTAVAAMNAKAAESGATVAQVKAILDAAIGDSTGFGSVKSDLQLSKDAKLAALTTYLPDAYSKFASESIDSTEADARITTVKSDATTAINGATTIAAVETAYTNAINSIDSIVAEYVSTPEKAIEDITKTGGLLDVYVAEKKAALPEGDTITGGLIDTEAGTQRTTIAALTSSTTAQIYTAFATAKGEIDGIISTRQALTYTVKYNGTTMADGSVKYGNAVTEPAATPVSSENAALKFDKWVTADGGSVEFDFTAKHYEAAGTTINLYASWKATDLEVTVHIVGTTDTQTVNAYKEDGNKGINLSGLTAAMGKKYEFYSSYTDATTNVPFDATSETAIEASTMDIYAVAVWKSNAEIAGESFIGQDIITSAESGKTLNVDHKMFTLETEDAFKQKAASGTPQFTKMDGTKVNPTSGINSGTEIAANATSGKIIITAKENISIRVYAAYANDGYSSNKKGTVYHTIAGGAQQSVDITARATAIEIAGNLNKGETIEIWATATDAGRLWLFGVETELPSTFHNATIVWKGANEGADISDDVNSAKKIPARPALADSATLGKCLGWADVENGAAADLIDFDTYRVAPGATVNLYPVYMEADVIVQYFIPTAVDADTGVHTFGTDSGTGTATEYSGATLAQATANANKGSLAGHAFKGWYTDSALTTEYDFDTTLTAGTVSLYAKYEKTSVLFSMVVDDCAEEDWYTGWSDNGTNTIGSYITVKTNAKDNDKIKDLKKTVDDVEYNKGICLNGKTSSSRYLLINLAGLSASDNYKISIVVFNNKSNAKNFDWGTSATQVSSGTSVAATSGQTMTTTIAGNSSVYLNTGDAAYIYAITIEKV